MTLNREESLNLTIKYLLEYLQLTQTFKQREQMKNIEEREQTKRMMQDNLDQLRMKREREKQQEFEEKIKFNSKVQHDVMYEQFSKT